MILLDCGGFLPPESSVDQNGTGYRRLIAKLGAEAMGVMKYDAIGLGGADLSLGTEFLETITSDAAITFVTTNLVLRDNKRSFGNRYAVLQVGDIRVGVLSVVPLGAFDGISDKKLIEGLEVINPAAAIKAVLPELKEKTNVIILLSRYDLEKTRLLVGELDGIDLIICSGDKDSRGGCGRKLAVGQDKGPFFKSSYGGEKVGYARLDIDANGQPVISRSRMISLGDSIPDDEKIVAITGNDIKDKIAEMQKKEQVRKIRELHKLSPSEYLEMLSKQSASKGEKQ